MQQVITEIIGGRLQILSDNVTSVLPHVTCRPVARTWRDGAAAHSARARHSDSGRGRCFGLRDYRVGRLHGPAGMPGPIVATLNAELNKVDCFPSDPRTVAGAGDRTRRRHARTFRRARQKGNCKMDNVIKRAGIKGD